MRKGPINQSRESGKQRRRKRSMADLAKGVDDIRAFALQKICPCCKRPIKREEK